jgi:phospholipid/cholesterol/gamma-HCH transport system substrate-binding protein
MTPTQQKIRIGVLTAIAGALVCAVVMVWGGVHLFKHRLRYAIDLDGSVYGLTRGAEVFFNGLPVGSVRSLEISNADIRRVRVHISVEDDTPIRADTKATLSLSGLTGSKVIDLRPGSPDTPPLPEDSVIAIGETTLDKLEKQAEEITGKSKQLLERADRIEASAETAMANLADITDPKRFADVIAQTRASIAELGRTTASVRVIFDDNRAPLRSAIADLRQASRSFKELAREVREQPSRMLISSPKGDRKLP